MPDAIDISVYMLTCDNIRTVEKAIESVRWADEIIVVDSGSRDGTLEIVRQHATRVIERPWPGFREQYQFAADACTHDWALFIDADEIVPPELAEEMRRELAANLQLPEDRRLAGFIAPRRTWYLGRWIRHGAWSSDREMRLYDRRRGSWQGGLHACIHVDGPSKRLKNAYLHDTYADIADHLDTLNRYSTTGARELAAAGKNTSACRAFWGGIGRFFRDYLCKGGFLDGFPGLVIAVGAAFGTFIKHAKLVELRTSQPPGKQSDATDANGDVTHP